MLSSLFRGIYTITRHTILNRVNQCSPFMSGWEGVCVYACARVWCVCVYVHARARCVCVFVWFFVVFIYISYKQNKSSRIIFVLIYLVVVEVFRLKYVWLLLYVRHLIVHTKIDIHTQIFILCWSIVKPLIVQSLLYIFLILVFYSFHFCIIFLLFVSASFSIFLSFLLPFLLVLKEVTLTH